MRSPVAHGRQQTAPLRVVIVGAGFGGLETVKRLMNVSGIDLTLIDQQNHHLFQPLLYQVATGVLSSADIASPLRSVFGSSDRVRILLSRVTGIDADKGCLRCDEREIPYDYLVMATGSVSTYFGNDAWSATARGLKTLDDAEQLRNRIVYAFERALLADDLDARRRLLTFVMIGGGATGVEMAGAIAEFIRDRLPGKYGVMAGSARVIIVDAGARVLAGFAPDISDRASSALRALNVELRAGSKVTDVRPGRVQVGDDIVEAETIIWSAGMVATPVASWLGIEPGHGGRIAVGKDLRILGHDHIFAIGDVALALDQSGNPLPSLAPVAQQQGRYVATVIAGKVRRRPDQAAFRYRDYGMLATIGRNKAVAQLGKIHFGGFAAWLLWAGVHITSLVSFRNRAVVCLTWAIAYVTRDRSSALISPAPSCKAKSVEGE